MLDKIFFSLVEIFNTQAFIYIFMMIKMKINYFDDARCLRWPGWVKEHYNIM